jgi:hypothetical protein
LLALEIAIGRGTFRSILPLAKVEGYILKCIASLKPSAILHIGALIQKSEGDDAVFRPNICAAPTLVSDTLGYFSIAFHIFNVRAMNILEKCQLGRSHYKRCP